jgi:hypothetical protein
MALSKDDIEDIKVGRAFEAMIATEGWQHFERLIKVHLETHRNRALQPFAVKQANKATDQVLFSSVDQLLTAEGDKGAIMGLSLALSLPSGIIENMQTLLAKGSDGDAE